MKKGLEVVGELVSMVCCCWWSDQLVIFLSFVVSILSPKKIGMTSRRHQPSTRGRWAKLWLPERKGPRWKLALQELLYSIIALLSSTPLGAFWLRQFGMICRLLLFSRLSFSGFWTDCLRWVERKSVRGLIGWSAAGRGPGLPQDQVEGRRCAGSQCPHQFLGSSHLKLIFLVHLDAFWLHVLGSLLPLIRNLVQSLASSILIWNSSLRDWWADEFAGGVSISV